MTDHHEARAVLASLPQDRTCTRCQETKPEDAFHRKGGGRRRSTCADCRSDVRPKWSETPAERFERKLWHEYRLTLEQYEALVLSQSGLCAICAKAPERGKRLVIDHCHTTGKVRALLCIYCNTVIGAYENHREQAAAYLATYGDGNPLLKQEIAR